MTTAVHPRAYKVATATISNTAKAISHEDFGLTAAEIAAADRAVITAHTNNVMATWDGTNPTTTLGHLLGTTHPPMIVHGSNIARLKFIRATGSDGAITVTLERY